MESGAVGHNLKWDYPRTIPAKSGLIWFSGFRGEVLNVIFYQNMPNLHNHPNTFIQGQYVFYYTECLMMQVCIMLLEGQLLKK